MAFKEMQQEIKSEHNMGQLDFYRYDALLKIADQIGLSVKIPPFEPSDVINYYKILDQIYINFRALMNQNNKKELDEIFKKIQDKIFSPGTINQGKNNIKIDVSLLYDLRELHKVLLEVKQILGLGVPVFKKEAQNKRLKRVLGI